MLDKLQLLLKSKIGQPYAYIFCCLIYLIGVYSIIGFVGYMYGVFLESVIITTTISIFRTITHGFHCKTNTHCIIISTILITIFSILSKNIPCEYSFLIAIICCRDIYIKSPLELNDEIDKSKEWYVKMTSLIIVILLSLSLIFYYFNLFIMCSSILWSIIIVDIMLFKNPHNDFI